MDTLKNVLYIAGQVALFGMAFGLVKLIAAFSHAAGH